MTGINQPVLLAVAMTVCFSPLLALRAQAPAAAQRPSASGIIRGRITAGDTRRPLRRAQIRLSAPELGTNGRTANTGLDGRYEFKDLPAARYTVTVSRSGYLSMQYGQQRAMEQARPLQLASAQTIENVDFELPRAAGFSGRVVDDLGEPIAGVLVWAMRPMYIQGRRQLVVASGGTVFEGTDDTGRFRVTGLVPGTYLLRAMTRETWTTTIDGTRATMAFAPTFFPGTASAADARLIEIGVGQQIRDVDFALVPQRAATLSGVAVDSRGQPLSGQSVGLTLRFSQGQGGGGMMSMASAPVAGDGSFTVRNVPPGEYELSASSGNPGTGDGEAARMLVAVDGVDIDTLRIVTTAGWSVTGRFVTDEGTVPQFGSGRATIGAAPVVSVAMSGVGTGEVNDDGTFLIRAAIGPSRIVPTVPDGWMVKAIRTSDRDITSTLMDLASGERLSDVDVVVSNRVSSVSGQITDDRGAPAATGTVVVFAEDAEKWGESTAFVRAARPDQQGRYEIKGLPSGDYLAVALDYVQNGMWNDPQFLESLRRDAQRFTLADGGSQALSLKVAP
jgi:hypothetical protein